MAEPQGNNQEVDVSVGAIRTGMERMQILGDLLGVQAPMPSEDGSLPDVTVALGRIKAALEMEGLDLDDPNSPEVLAFSSDLSAMIAQNPSLGGAFGSDGNVEELKAVLLSADEFVESTLPQIAPHLDIKAMYYELEAGRHEGMIVGAAQAYGVAPPDDATDPAIYIQTVFETIGATIEAGVTERMTAFGADETQVSAYISDGVLPDSFTVAQANEINQIVAVGMADMDAVEKAAVFLSNPALPAVLEAAPTQAAVAPTVTAGATPVVQTGEAPAVQPAVAVQTEPQPDRDISAYVADNKLVQETIAAAIENVKGSKFGTAYSAAQLMSSFSSDAPDLPDLDLSQIPEMSRQDGQWDDQSLDALNGIVQMLKGSLALEGDYPPGYSIELGSDMRAAFASKTGPERGLYDLIISEADMNLVLASLDKLAAADELRPVTVVRPVTSVQVSADAVEQQGLTPTSTQEEVVLAAGATQEVSETLAQPDDAGASAVVEEETSDIAPPSIGADIFAVEAVMVEIGAAIEQQGGQLAGNFGGILEMIGADGAADGIVSKALKPITEADIGGDFGENSQEMFAKLMVAVKTLNGTVDPARAQSNYDGSYDADALRFAVLTNPMFAEMRDSLGVRQMSVEEANQFLNPKADIYANPEEMESRRQQVITNYGLAGLENFVGSLDRIAAHDGDLLNKKKARETDMYSIGLGLAGDVFGNSWLEPIKSFFQSLGDWAKPIVMLLEYALGTTAIGKFLGFDNEELVAENFEPAMAGQFTKIYDAAKTELGQSGQEPSHEQVMEHLGQDVGGIADKLKNSAVYQKFAGTFLQEDEAFVERSLQEAIKQATQTDNFENARDVFANSMEQAARGYQARLDAAQVSSDTSPVGPDEDVLKPDPISYSVDDASGAFVRDAVYTPGENNAQVTLAHAGAGGDPSAEDIAAETRRALEETGSNGAPAGEVIGQKTTGVGFDRDLDPNDYLQLDRYSNGRMAIINGIVLDNFAQSGLSEVHRGGLTGRDGQATDYATKAVMAAHEEHYLRAQIHRDIKFGAVTYDTIDDDYLSSLDHKFDGQEDMAVVVDYMADKGFTGIEAYKNAMVDIDSDLRSAEGPNNRDLLHSVWDHSNVYKAYGVGAALPGQGLQASRGQIDINLLVEQIRREQAPVVAPVPRVEREVPLESDVPVSVREVTPEAKLPPAPASLAPQDPCTHVETFMHLRAMTDAQERALNIGLYEALTIPEGEPNAGYNPLNPNLNTLDQMLGAGYVDGYTHYAFLDPKDFDVELEGVDLIVAHRENDGDLDIRFVNYEQDGIRPISQHSRRDFNESYDPNDTIQGSRRLDDVLFAHSRRNLHAVEPGANGGYRMIGAIVPAERGMNGYRGMTAYEALYPRGRNEDNFAYRQAIGEYSQGFSARTHAMSVYEGRVNLRAGDRGRAFESDRDSCGVVPPREQFADAVGRDDERVIAPLSASVSTQAQREGKPGLNPLQFFTVQIDALANAVTGRRGDGNTFPAEDGWVVHRSRDIAENTRDTGTYQGNISGYNNTELGAQRGPVFTSGSDR